MYDDEYVDNIFGEIVQYYEISEKRFPKLAGISVALGSVAIMTLDSFSDRYLVKKDRIGYESLDINTRYRIGKSLLTTATLIAAYTAVNPVVTLISQFVADAGAQRLDDLHNGITARPN